jgi:hypothetical protein
MTSLPTDRAGHPVLIETTRTYLVWIQADTPAVARRMAAKNPEQFLDDPDACDGAPVDTSTDTAPVTEETAAWLDLAPEVYQRLDDYFAAIPASDDHAQDAA